MNEQALRFRVGLFVLGSLAVLAVLIILFGALPTLFTPHVQYTLVFRDAPGVEAGTPVRRSGVRIGEVRDLSLDDASGRVRVRIAVDPRHPLRQGDQAVISHGVLGGDTNIDVVPPRDVKQPAERPPLPTGTELPGQSAADVRTVLNQTSEILPSTQQTLEEIRRSLRTFDPLAPQMEEAIREYRALARATREAIPELRRTNDEVRELTKSTRDLLPEFRRTNEEVQTTARNWGRLGERLDVLVQTNEDKVVKTLDNFNDAVVRIGATFSEENQRNLNATLKNVRSGTEPLESISRNTDQLVKEGRQTLKRVNDSVSRSDEVLGNLQQATRPMAERSGNTMRNLDESADKLNRTMSDVRELLRAVGAGDGTLRRFVADPSLYNNLNDAACMLVRIMPRLDRMLHDLEVFADKIARHPESLGIRGAVSPSSGLKEAPTGGVWPNR